MLRWRLALGTLFIGLLALLCWLELQTSLPGIWFMPLALLVAGLGADEIVGLARARGLPTSRVSAVIGTLLVVGTTYVPHFIYLAHKRPPTHLLEGHGPMAGLAAGIIFAILVEMFRYRQPGEVIARLSVSVFAMVYVGVLLSFVVQIRNLFSRYELDYGLLQEFGVQEQPAWGLYALVSLIAVVKLSDIGAYTVGRLIGRHKMAPILSPGKTWEGAVGGILFSCIGSFLIFKVWLAQVIAYGTTIISWGWLAFGISMAIIGMIGDLAESLMKRDAGRKDSSTWLPGFGGVLDLLDSILLAAPVAYLFWATGLVFL